MTAGPNNNSANTLLSPSEPGPFRVINPLSEVPLLLICDHASCRFPESLGDLGLDPFARRCHLAIDIGAGALTEALAHSLAATAVLHNYSRLIVDCNRQLMDPGAFLEYGDGILVPGNRNLHQSDKDARANALYWPYHRAIDEQIARLGKLGRPPAFVSIHSFTPVLNGESRAWQIGVLWDKDEQLRKIFLEGFRASWLLRRRQRALLGKSSTGLHHRQSCRGTGLPHVGIEIRQDLLGSEAAIEQMAGVMHKIMATIPGRVVTQSERIPA